MLPGAGGQTHASPAQASGLKSAVWLGWHRWWLRLATSARTEGMGQDCTQVTRPSCHFWHWGHTVIFSTLAQVELGTRLFTHTGKYTLSCSSVHIPFFTWAAPLTSVTLCTLMGFRSGSTLDYQEDTFALLKEKQLDSSYLFLFCACELTTNYIY